MGNEVTIVVKARETGAGRVFSRVADSARKMRSSIVRDATAVSGAWQDASGRWHDASGRFIAANERTGWSLEKLRAKVRELLPDILRTLGKAASMATSVGAVFAGPVVTGILGAAKAVTALGKASAQLAPLAAFLPSIVASAGLLKGTLMLAGPGMLRAIEPLTKKFANTDKEVGAVTKTVQRLASVGLQDLAKKFVKVNLPAIEEGMAGIATNINKVVVSTGKWLNSIEGQHLIRTITWATADAADKLAPKFSRAAIALGRLVDRAGDKAISSLANLLGKAADKATKLMNSVSKADIENALTKAKDAGEGLFGKLTKIKDAVIWLGEHKDMLTGISDALAVTSIAIGAASGNWIAVIAGAATLILNHFDLIKKGVSKIWSGIANDPGVQMIWAAVMRIARAIKEDLQDAFETARPYIERFGQSLKQAWDKAAPLIAKFLENPNVIAGIKTIALGIAALAAAFIAMQVATALAVGAIVGGLAGALAWLLGTFVGGVLGAVATVIRAFGQMMEKIGESMSTLPGKAGEIGRQMQKIGKDSQAAATKVEGLRDRLGSLQSKTVTVTFGARFTPGSGDIFRAYGAGAGLGVLKKATGGVVGGFARAATGGARGGAVLVGEHGPELVNLAPGSMVHSAPQTRRKMLSGLRSGLAGAIAGSTRDVTAAMDKLMAAMKKSGDRGAQGIVTAFRERFLDIAKKREAVLAPLRQVVTEARKNYVDLVNSVRDSVISSGAIGGNQTFQQIVGNLSSQVTSTKQFASVLAKLRTAGLDSTSISQLVAQGSDLGLASARSILSSGTSGIRQVVDLQRELAKAGTSLGTQAAESRYRPDIVKAEATLYLQTSGSKVDDFIIEILRRSIRTRGGNVQLVLGKGGAR